MTEGEFERRVAATSMSKTGKTYGAARRVLVDGKTRNDAANEAGIHISVVMRGVERLCQVQLEPIVCPACGTRF